MVPLLVLLPELTGSGVWGALVLAVDTGIIALLLPYTGTIADRFDRKKIMIVANLAALGRGRCCCSRVRSAATARLALVAIGAVAVAKAFYSPAAAAALPNVVDPEDLPAANAVAGSAWGTMAIVGASLGGIVSAPSARTPASGSPRSRLVLAAVLAWRIRRPLQAPRERRRAAARGFAAIGEALRYIGAGRACWRW